jgi:hypothetical protein
VILVEYFAWTSAIRVYNKTVHRLSMAIKELKELSPVWDTLVPCGMKKIFPDIRYGIPDPQFRSRVSCILCLLNWESFPHLRPSHLSFEAGFQ